VGRFATLLMDAASQTGRLKVILISAPDAEGKSDFALALGRTLASDYRRRTLVVDFDALPRADAQIAHQPHIRLPSNLPAPLNFGHSAIARLWLAMDPHHVSFSNPRVPLVDLKVCLDAIRPHFDHILVVGQKEFGQYAARRLYALADASILLVRAEKTRLPAVRQLKEIILASGGNILGFVFTFRDYYIPERLYKWL
jgi:cellulose biosynthesis protein BcsQ